VSNSNNDAYKIFGPRGEDLGTVISSGPVEALKKVLTMEGVDFSLEYDASIGSGVPKVKTDLLKGHYDVEVATEYERCEKIKVSSA
jgi:hypothetical protein